MSIKVNDSKDPVVEQDSLLVQVDYANQPIPNNRLPKGLYYSFKDKWVDMITLLTPAIKKIVTANTTVPAWGSITGTLSNQTDLQSALDGKEPLIADGTTSDYWRGDKSWQVLDKTAVGLSNVDNTSDANKPISTATQTALDLKTNKSEVEIILFKSSTTTVVTGKTLETSIYSIPLPNDGFNYIIEIYSQAQITTFAGAAITQRFRTGTYASPIDGLTGANSIGLQTLLATNGAGGATQIELLRRYKYNGGASGSIYGVTTGSNISDDANTLGPFTTLTSRDLTVQNYLYVTFNPTSSSAVISHSMITVKLIKI